MRFALVLFYITGIGFAPNDVNLPVYCTGAVLALFGGGIGMLLFGIAILSKASARALALFTWASGTLSIAATVLLSSEVVLGIGVGGMERVVAYPYLKWLTLTGDYHLVTTICLDCVNCACLLHDQRIAGRDVAEGMPLGDFIAVPDCMKDTEIVSL